MRRLPLLLLALAAPALGQQGDGGVAVPPAAPGASADAGVAAAPEAGVGRHFAFTWDTKGPSAGEADVQLWLTPRWGRLDGFTAFDLRAGVLQGLPRDWAAGVFIDAFPSSRGVTQEPAIDARLTLHVQNRGTLGRHLAYGAQAEVGAGVNGFAVAALAALDADLGPVRIALNVDGFTQTAWSSRIADAFTTSRARQTLGFSYTLANGFSFGIEAQNRLSWVKGDYLGDAVLLGPAIAYRGTRFWWNISMLPQVAAHKPEAQRGGDPLELIDNERFTLRLSGGVIAR